MTIKDDIAPDLYTKCQHCEGNGWYVQANYHTGEPEQVQCGHCLAVGFVPYEAALSSQLTKIDENVTCEKLINADERQAALDAQKVDFDGVKGAYSGYGSFYSGDKPDGKFAALYEDGSGAALFMKIDGQNGRDAYMAADCGDEIEYDWFFEAGYSIWVRLPDKYTLWCERNIE